MATNTHVAIASVNAGLNAALDAACNGGSIKIYTGAQPATPDVAIGAQVLLATLPLSATAFGASSGGVKTANAITSAAAVANGTAAWFRVMKSDGVTGVLDGSVGTASADMVLGSIALSTGIQVQITSWTVSQAQ